MLNNSLTLVDRAAASAGRTAIGDVGGTYTYSQLLLRSAEVASRLLDGESDLSANRVAFLVPPSFEYVAVQWGIWRAGGVAVPLAVSHPPAELDYVLGDADVEAVVSHSQFTHTLAPLAAKRGLRFLETDTLAAGDVALPKVVESRPAMILYTSGTTGRPKGVVITHANIAAQVRALVEAWEWCADDRVLLVLPLHHVHGIVNVLTCALWSGARCDILPKFDAQAVWQCIGHRELTLFMAVPTIYRRLVTAWEGMPSGKQHEYSDACRRMRLMVSGSAALPIATLDRWAEITGHVLLERYGMTEIGMALSNPLHGERRPGHVGRPLPGVSVRLAGEDGEDVPDGSPGQILVRGPGVFEEYWRRSEETREAFTSGWFLTGDTAVVDDGAYRILGRTSIDIIKTGGFKVSALEIEDAVREHPAVLDCAVVGIDDADWGERVCVAAEVAAGHELTIDALRKWAAERLAPYKIPSKLLCVASLPRNAMGKVTKPDVAALFADD